MRNIEPYNCIRGNLVICCDEYVFVGEIGCGRLSQKSIHFDLPPTMQDVTIYKGLTSGNNNSIRAFRIQDGREIER